LEDIRFLRNQKKSAPLVHASDHEFSEARGSLIHATGRLGCKLEGGVPEAAEILG
jgi:hypothetical protein